ADLDDRARALRRIHDAVLSGARPPEYPRPLVARSWQRAISLGLHPDAENRRGPSRTADIAALRERSPLRDVIGEVRAVLTGTAEAANYIVVVTDADGAVLWREGAVRTRAVADRLGFVEGARWTEDRVGTNAIGTTLAEAAPVELFAAEHFEQQQHPWYCSAAPIHDPRTGEVIGVVDVSGPARTLHPAIGALVRSSARLAEVALWSRHEQRLDRLRRSAEHLMRSGPALIVDDDGWVAHHVGTTPRDRVAAPASGRLIAIPGVGICVPERLPDGWLLRPAGQRGPVRARLVGNVLEVWGDGEQWTVTLTPRHAEIVRLLTTAGPAGLTAAELSAAVFGDRDHEISARAEVSRLRRVLGSLVATAPYRIADGVVIAVADPSS
ncbi:GAF domain-containing protein, partial [Microbacterium sp.]|uniref:GAF domain-containing protein n=1 Tax=Microbacterium sp. TaxID=51671 RepID=UPI003C739D39